MGKALPERERAQPDTEGAEVGRNILIRPFRVGDVCAALRLCGELEKEHGETTYFVSAELQALCDPVVSESDDEKCFIGCSGTHIDAVWTHLSLLLERSITELERNKDSIVNANPNIFLRIDSHGYSVLFREDVRADLWDDEKGFTPYSVRTESRYHRDTNKWLVRVTIMKMHNNQEIERCGMFGIHDDYENREETFDTTVKSLQGMLAAFRRELDIQNLFEIFK